MNKINSVLVTGGTGSFGQAFVSHLLKTSVQRICIYSRGEHAQASMRARFGDDPRLRWFVGDVRDVDRLRRAMCRCDTVVHAAALKRIEVGHYNPDEMVKTNVLGAMNVIEAAGATPGVRYVVMLSTDKAYQPVSAYGQSKALAESLFLASNDTYGQDGPRYAVTRYGNVWASEGSVVPKWLSAKRFGVSPVTLTDPDCTRYFMTMDQAVALVWDTLCTMRGGELVIPRDLPAYRLGDLAEVMCVEYQVTGLPAWEKLHESMDDGLCSKDARRMSVEELRGLIDGVQLQTAIQ